MKKELLTKPLDLRLFDHLEPIYGAIEMKEFEENVMIKKAYQCATVMNQLAKLQMLEFDYDILTSISVDKILSCIP